MARISLPTALLLLILGIIRVQGQSAPGSCEPCESKLTQLKADSTGCQKSRKAAATERQALEARVSTLEQSQKDAEQLASSMKKELEAKLAQTKSQLDAAEKRAAGEEKARKEKEKLLEQATKKAEALEKRLKETSARLEAESSITQKLHAVLPSTDGSKTGELLVERVKQTVAYEKTLGKEVDTLKSELSGAQKQAQECESRRKLGSKAEEEVQRLQERIQKLEKEELKRLQEQLDEASKAWLPPWVVEGLESVQDTTEHHWTHTVVPTAKLVRSQSLDALEKTQKAAEPHIAYFLQRSNELGLSTREALKPHLAVAKQRHAEAMSWFKQQAAELHKAAEPHISAATQYAKEGLEKAHVAAAPYLKQASDVLMPYYQEAYTAAKPGLQAMQASATKYWHAASESLAPQLESLAEAGAHYHRQMSGVVSNVSQQVTGTQLDPDVLQFTQIVLYLLTLMLPLLVVLQLVGRLCKRSTSAAVPQKKVPASKAKPGAPHAKKHSANPGSTHPKKHHTNHSHK